MEKNGIPAREAARIILQVAAGLQAAHSAGLLHRDIKPANILMDEKNDLAKLADFGLVRNIEGGTMTQADVFCGTPEYVSPEQVANPNAVDKRSDIYSLGVTLFECLTGIAPFRGSPMEILEQHKNNEPIAPQRLQSTIPDDIQNVCLKAMQRLPSARYQTAEEFAQDLQRFLDGVPVHAKPVSALNKAVRWCMRNQGVTAFAATSLLLLIALAAGSTIASIQLRNANTLLTNETQKARDAQQVSQQNRKIAVNTLNNLIDEVYEDLTDNAASIKSRQALANSVIEGFTALTKANSEEMADNAIWSAHMRIAELAQLQGDNQTCIDSFKTAIKIAEESMQSNSSDWDPVLSHAIATARLAQHIARLGYENASQELDKAIELFENISPPTAEVDQWLLSLDVSKLDRERQNFQDQQGMVDTGLEIERKHAAILNSDIESTALLEELQAFYFVIGRAMLDLGQADKARQKLTQVERSSKEQIELRPNNRSFQTQLAIMMRAQGMSAGWMGDLEAAETLISNALSQLVTIGREDPENYEAKLHIANTRSIMADSYSSKGDYQNAAEQLELAIAGHQQYLQNVDANTVQMVLLEAYLKLSSNYLTLEKVEEAYQIMKVASEQLSTQTEGKEPSPIENWYQSAIASSLEILNVMCTGVQDDSSADAKFGAAIWFARFAAAKSDSIQVPDETLEKITAAHPTFKHDTFPQLFSFLFQQEDVQETVKSTLIGLEVTSYGLLYSNLKSKNASPADISEVLSLLIGAAERNLAGGGLRSLASLRSSPELQDVSSETKWQDFLRSAAEQLQQ